MENRRVPTKIWKLGKDNIIVFEFIGKNMKEIIKRYIALAEICFNTDYADKKQVKKHNKSVDKMYEIVRQIENSQDMRTKNAFIQLLNLQDYRTDLWVSIHLLECMSVEDFIKEKALSVIKDYIKKDDENRAGLEFWLNDYYKNENL